MTKTKTCTKCGEEKPATLEYFYKDSLRRTDCRVCYNRCYQAAYREANKEAVKAYNEAYREANKEAIAEKKKAYREANREAILEQHKAYYKANKEAINERKKAYREANKEAIAEQKKAWYRTSRGKFACIKRASRVRGINFSLPFELYETQLWGKPCHYCGCEIEVTGLDRKDSDKGYTPDNVVPCCADCNVKKSTKPYEQFIQEQKESRGS